MKKKKDEGYTTITPDEMGALDENCKFFGLIPLQLMENAGVSIASEIKKRFSGLKSTLTITILAGTGNNGGDAFVAARHLDLQWCDVKILLLGRSNDLRTEEATRNWRILNECGYATEELVDSSSVKAAAVSARLNASDVIIDALFGTGISGKIREPERTGIDMINAAKRDSNAFVLAVDAPSGLNADTGEAERAVKADLTVTFHKAKRGLLKEIAAEYVGELRVADIGIPRGMEKLAGPGDLRLVVKRNARSHKGDNGRVLIVGGGPFFGAPTLTALAALRAGADWVTIAAPRGVSSIVSSFSPNLIVLPLSSEILVEKDVPVIVESIKKHDVVVIGMGLGTEEETKRAVRAIINDTASKKVVVDADGLYGLQVPMPVPVEWEEKLIIATPHAGELSKLGIMDISRVKNIVTVMKGPVDIISDSTGTSTRVKINRTGNAGMTVGGTGDVLAGLVGAFFAISSDPFKAATAAAFVNGIAGDRAFDEKGYGLLATDVIEAIPRVIREYVDGICISQKSTKIPKTEF